MDKTLLKASSVIIRRKFRLRFSQILDQFGWSCGQQINGKLLETIFPESSLLVTNRTKVAAIKNCRYLEHILSISMTLTGPHLAINLKWYK